MGSLLRFRVVRTAEGLSGGTAAMGIIQEYPQIFGWTPLQRFWISGPDLGIAADFARGLALGLQRFLISGPDLGITAASRRCKEEWPACSGRSGDDIRVRFYYSSRKRGEADLS